MGLLDKAMQMMMGKANGVPGAPDEKMQDAADQPKEDQELVGYVKNFVEEVRNQATRISSEGIWMTNIAYILGFDNIFYDPMTRTFRPVGGPSSNPNFVKRNRIHENVILPACQKRAARMTKQPPKYDVRPNSMDEDDKEAARLGLEVINGVFDRQKVLRKRAELSMWLQECGHAYIGVSFDDSLGEPLINPETGEIAGKEGDIRVDVASAFECFADPLAKTFDDVKKFARCKVRKLDYFRRYERGHMVKEEGVWLLSAQYEMRINTMNTVGPSSSGTAEQMKGAAIEISYYEAPSPGYPNGRHIIAANGILLKNGELQVGEIPYAKFDDTIVAGKYYSETPVTHARPLQDQLNRVLVKRAEWTNRLLAGKYIAAKGHGLIQEALNTESGEVVEYDPIPGIPEPHAMTLPVIPQYAYTEYDSIKKAIWDIFNLSEVSQGKLPSASIPAIGINLLLEQDETTIGFEVEGHEHSWARVGMLILKFSAKYCITDRKLKSKGTNMEYNVRTYNGEMLRENFDVTVIRGSTVPNSKVLKRQDIMNLYQSGLIGSPEDPAVKMQVLGQMEYGEESESWKRYHLNMSQVQRTIKQLEQGILPVVDEKDNHVMHLDEKNNYRLSEKWDRLPPAIQQLFQLDMKAHTDIVIGQMNPALAQPPEDPMPPPPPPEVSGLLQPMAPPQQGAVAN